MLSIIGEFEWQCRDIGPGMPLPYTSDGDTYMPVRHSQSVIYLMQFSFFLTYNSKIQQLKSCVSLN